MIEGINILSWDDLVPPISSVPSSTSMTESLVTCVIKCPNPNNINNLPNLHFPTEVLYTILGLLQPVFDYLICYANPSKLSVMSRPRTSSNLGADPRGDTSAPALSTLNYKPNETKYV
jgi:hypothetical protein